MSRKQFGANGVGLRVKRRFDVLYVQHLLDSAIKLAVTFPQNFEKVVCLCSVFATLCSKLFTYAMEEEGGKKSHLAPYYLLCGGGRREKESSCSLLPPLLCVLPPCCDVFGVLVEYEPPAGNMSERVSTGWRSARNMLRTGMLGYVGLTCCDHLGRGG